MMLLPLVSVSGRPACPGWPSVVRSQWLRDVMLTHCTWRQHPAHLHHALSCSRQRGAGCHA
jgi:hypothetical protein